MDLSIVVPVYNSEKSLPQLIERLAAVLPQLAGQFEVILVNDGSRDDSWNVIRALTVQYPWVFGVDLMRNYGQHNALLCGIRQARYPITITMDDDLQHPPEELHVLLEALNNGYDVVYGRPAQEQHNFLRDLASKITKIALQSAMGAETARNVSALRAFRTALRDSFVQYLGPFPSVDVLLTWGTSRFTAVPVHHEPRKYGESNYTFGKLVRHAMNMMTGFSIVPLQLASWIGFIFTIFGLLVLAYVIGRYIILGGSVPGFPFLASIIAIFSGAQLLVLGIMGEYLARMHFRLMDRPTYTVRQQSARQTEGQHGRG
ncbi:glycosyltransferase [Longilinea arvoryzae]|uniref:Glycosyltransferase n=1 Tax=Longilinea arvoryzae TaxID=360412 RepID=A0A0S7BER8_9CHLR|nr:glycosyltransferase family 2 protein [Longilinea arvoryzae]GAP13456.1 glycosyltransferase [Longilinea arvoryzae]